MIIRSKVALCLAIVGVVLAASLVAVNREQARLRSTFKRIGIAADHEVKGAEKARDAATDLAALLRPLADSANSRELLNESLTALATRLTDRIEQGLRQADAGTVEFKETLDSASDAENRNHEDRERQAAAAALASLAQFRQRWSGALRSPSSDSGASRVLVRDQILPLVHEELLPACSDYLRLSQEARAVQAANAEEILSQIARFLLIGGLLSVGALAAAGIYLFRGVVRPLDNLVKTATAVAGGDTGLRVQIGHNGPDEFGALSLAFNHMLDRLEADTVRRDELERKIVERSLELTQSEHRFRQLFHASPVAASLGDYVTGELLDVNEKFCEMGGWSHDEVIGRTAAAAGLGWNWTVPTDPLRAKLEATGRFSDAESRFTRRDGTIRQVGLSAEVLTLAGRKTVLTGYVDFTARHDGEQALREREQLLSSINANLSGTCVYRMIYHADGRMECSYVSPNIEEFIGVPGAQIRADARIVFSVIHPENRAAFQETIRAAVHSGGLISFTTRVNPVHGGEMWAQFRSRLVERRPDGAQVRDGIVVDITGVKAAEAELRFVRERLELALQSSRTCIWDDDLAAGQITIDPMWAKMRGFAPTETLISWRRLMETAHPDDRRGIIARARRAIYGETDEYQIEQRVSTHDGNWIWIMSHGRVIARDAEGRARRMIGTNTDITARKQAEEKVRLLNANLEHLVAERTAALAARTTQLGKSEALFRNLVENINQCYFVADADNRFTYCNPAAVAILGLPERELLGTSALLLIASEDHDRVQAALHHWVNAGWREATIEYRVRAGGGATIWVEQSSTLVRDAAGDVTEYRHVMRDVSERKAAEALLRQSEERLALTLDATLDGLWDWSIETGHVYFSPQWERLLGYAPKEVPQRVEFFFEVLHPEDRSRVNQLVNDHLAGRSLVKQDEIRLRQKSGEFRWFHDRGKVVSWNDAGLPHRMVGTITDITERKRAEEMVRLSEQRQELALAGADLGLWDWNIATGEVLYDDRWCSMIGYTLAEVKPNADTWRLLIHPDDWAPVKSVLDRHLKGETTAYETEFRMRHKSGHWRWLLARGKVVERDSKGGPLRMAGTHMDITERKQSHEALQSVVREKEALLREVHHRVKNNLQVITSLLRLEAARGAQADAKTALTAMKGRIRAMALLHESLYRSGTFAAIDLGAYLKQIATQSFRSLVASPAAIRLELDLASIQVTMDDAIPCGLLINELISNSLKHGFPEGREGEVRVGLHLVAGGTQIRLRVSDTGVGLPLDFETRRGQSLGLQLVSDLALQLQGTLEFEPGAAAISTITFSPNPPRVPAPTG